MDRAACGHDQRFEALGSKSKLRCGDHRLGLAHFFECLQSSQPFGTTTEDGMAAKRLADAATESWQSGQTVRM